MEKSAVNSYRAEVERVIAVHHARLEMGLSRAREQEAFVRRVADVLMRHRVAFTWGLDTDFDAVFRLADDVTGEEPLLQTLFAGCLLARTPDGFVLGDARQEYIQVRFKGGVNEL